MLLEWMFFVGLLTIIALLLSRLLLQPVTVQNGSSSAATTTEVALSADQTTFEAEAGLFQPIPPVLEVTSVIPESAFFDTGLLDREAPNFTLPILGGDEFTLSTLRGQAVWINFWASWCAPCRIEMPLLTAAYERYRGDGLVIIGLNVTEQDTLDAVNSFITEFDVVYPIVLDQPGHVSNDRYNLIGLPMSVFIDRAGIVKRVVVGAVTEEEVDPFVAEILEEVE